MAARLGRWSRARLEAKLPRYILGVRPLGETRARRGEDPRASVSYRDLGRERTPPPERHRDRAAGAAAVAAACAC